MMRALSACCTSRSLYASVLARGCSAPLWIADYDALHLGGHFVGVFWVTNDHLPPRRTVGLTSCGTILAPIAWSIQQYELRS